MKLGLEERKRVRSAGMAPEVKAGDKQQAVSKEQQEGRGK